MFFRLGSSYARRSEISQHNTALVSDVLCLFSKWASHMMASDRHRYGIDTQYCIWSIGPIFRYGYRYRNYSSVHSDLLLHAGTLRCVRSEEELQCANLLFLLLLLLLLPVSHRGAAVEAGAHGGSHKGVPPPAGEEPGELVLLPRPGEVLESRYSTSTRIDTCCFLHGIAFVLEC